MQHMTDSHFHALAMKQKGIDPAIAIRECLSKGFTQAVDIGLCPEDLDDRLRLLSEFSEIFFSSGLSPAESDSPSWADRARLVNRQASSGRLVAIGEIGLDWHWNYGTRLSQIELFEAQLTIAKRHGLPVIIHNREADADILSLLTKADLPAAGVMHCFSSNYLHAKRCLELGFYISFAGNVSYKNAHGIQEAAQRIPLDRILLETDAPYLSPQAKRGNINRPEYIAHTYHFVANLRKIPVDFLAEEIHRNFHDIFIRNSQLSES